ncbi:Transporter protein SLAC1/Mae1/ Ssu1/TehA [Dillenia turbinata]|uniref:Transporter protein SLAC1/Mae1/ Ssu1/TehA n=1 Tax=Dillenia turbinata TaxID=194707 RepID=A0AAN8V6L1_9MAGN
MENSGYSLSAPQNYPEIIPSLIDYIGSKRVAGFDSIEANNNVSDHSQEAGYQPSLTDGGSEVPISQNDASQTIKSQHSVSISMPSSPVGALLQSPKRVLFSDKNETIPANEALHTSAQSETASSQQPKTKYYSQPMPRGSANPEVVIDGACLHHFRERLRNPRMDRLKDKRFDPFKTWSGRLERQISNLRGKPQEEPEANVSQSTEIEALPVDRYFDALEGPELDTLRASEEIVLPEDKQWPFLLRFPISSFGICLGISSQAIMWKTLATSPSTDFLHISLTVNLVLWCISLVLTAIVSLTYILKVILYFEAVRREYYHPIRVNFFFAPWIVLLFLALGVPPSVAKNLHASLWYILMTPIFCLELKIYGQWMSGGQRRLSKVANPSNHLSIVGNFVGALLGASMGLKEAPIFFFAVGLAHYTVLFVTLYQRLPTNETLPKELHPVFFLFVAAPSVASMAWAKIQGSFDHGSRISYFIALFLYFSLAVRINFFRGFRFSLAWWAYTFPMTGASIATIKYTNEITNPVTQSLSVILCSVAMLTVTALLITTCIHAFVLQNLFPNDIAIAISDKRPKSQRKWFHLRTGSSDTRDIENYLKFAFPDSKDNEASPKAQVPDDEALGPNNGHNV